MILYIIIPVTKKVLVIKPVLLRKVVRSFSFVKPDRFDEKSDIFGNNFPPHKSN